MSAPPQQPPKPQETGFPPIDFVEEELATRPLPLHELPRQVGIDNALGVIEHHHPRIAGAIRMFWGRADCVEYIQQLILSGADNTGKARVGFKPEVLTALMSLTTLHQVDR